MLKPLLLELVIGTGLFGSSSLAYADTKAVTKAAQKTFRCIESKFDNRDECRGDSSTKDARDCLKEAAAALAAGVPGTTVIDLDGWYRESIPGVELVHHGDDGLQYAGIKLSLLSDNICKVVLGKALVLSISEAAAQAAVALDHLAKGEATSMNDMDMAVADAAACSKAVKEGLATGVPADTSLEFHAYESGVDSPLPLGEVDAKLCQKALATATDANKNCKPRSMPCMRPISRCSAATRRRCSRCTIFSVVPTGTGRGASSCTRRPISRMPKLGIRIVTITTASFTPGTSAAMCLTG